MEEDIVHHRIAQNIDRKMKILQECFARTRAVYQMTKRTEQEYEVTNDDQAKMSEW